MHDSANDLYDASCDLLAAAQILHRAAQRTGSEAALAPVLGCLQETLQELADACGTVGRRRAVSREPEAEELREALDGIARRLLDAASAGDDAREIAGALYVRDRRLHA